jgi:hypothetical protein
MTFRIGYLTDFVKKAMKPWAAENEGAYLD